jgi:hypothetical protein
MERKYHYSKENGGTSLGACKELGLKENVKSVKYIFKYNEQITSK